MIRPIEVMLKILKAYTDCKFSILTPIDMEHSSTKKKQKT